VQYETGTKKKEKKQQIIRSEEKKKTEEKTDMEGSRRSLPFHIFCLLIFTNSHR